MAKKKDKKSLNIEEIKTKISDSRTELLNLRFKRKSGQLENTSQFKKIKKEIARFLTMRKMKEDKKDA
tara:strand:- start:1157 stop:1360 length:204 start_codon:yes stop_codon:yes gene_type:complete